MIRPVSVLAPRRRLCGVGRLGRLPMLNLDLPRFRPALRRFELPRAAALRGCGEGLSQKSERGRASSATGRRQAMSIYDTVRQPALLIL